MPKIMYNKIDGLFLNDVNSLNRQDQIEKAGEDMDFTNKLCAIHGC
jgi:hypothetical protein